MMEKAPGESPSDEGRPRRPPSGIALSGGGIRSATFNLGLLQQLAERHLLGHFDFVSTVSGGGFIGGWWAGYRKRKPQA
jgi:predicted acylesterase/phospholipase RssA